MVHLKTHLRDIIGNGCGYKTVLPALQVNKFDSYSEIYGENMHPSGLTQFSVSGEGQPARGELVPEMDGSDMDIISASGNVAVNKLLYRWTHILRGFRDVLTYEPQDIRLEDC